MSLQATPVGDEEANILTSHHLHANIINIPETNEEFNYKQYPYTYRRTKNGNGLFASITQWMFKSIVYGVCFILLSPLLIPLYLIVIIHWQYNLISNRNELKKEESIKPLLIKCFHITVITMLTLMSLYLGPILWFIYNDRPKISLIASRFSWVSILLFCLFRESIVLRLARWHVRDKNIVTLQYIQRHCPQWFLKWFIRNLYLHKLLIKDYDETKIYLHIGQDKLRGKFSIIQQNESITLDVKRFVLDFHFAKNFYDKEHYYYRWMISIGIFVLILTPFLFDSFSVDMIFEILLTTGIAFILWIIWMEIEGRIIYALLKYLDCMKQFGELLCMNKDEKTKKYERIFKRETGSKKDADRARKIGINSDDIISLSHGYNANIWIENHLMMSTEANLYFKRFQYIFFSLMIGVVLVAFIFAYNLIIITTPILSLQMLVMCIGFLNVIFVWSEMLIISNKFSKLEKKHIEALINQKVWIQQKIFDLNIRNQNIDTSDFNIFHLQQTLILIDHLQQKLQLNGLSPKIAGISMDKAFIRVTWSLIISMITSGFAYYLRKNV